MFFVGFLAKFGIDLTSDVDWNYWQTLGEEISGQFGAITIKH
jgi:hypothetical protein